MACDCKRVEKLQNMIPNANEYRPNKQGIWGFVQYAWILFLNILMKCGVLLLFVIVTPIIIIMLSYNFIFKGKTTLFLPKNISKHMIKTNTESNEEYASEQL